MVVGFDGSRSSEHALAYANGIASRLGAGLVIVHVVQIPALVSAFAALGTYPVDPFVGYPGQIGRTPDPASDRQSPPALDCRIEEILGSNTRTWTLMRRFGKVHEELGGIARELQADVVVIGKPRRKFRNRFRSVARLLIRQSQQPLVTVP